MTKFDMEIVGKIGSMALINKTDRDIDYNIFSRLGKQLHPGMVWVSSGAVEIGRIDYMQRNAGSELTGDSDENIKADYASQGQIILMQKYREFIPKEYGVRQVLVEHQHFNDMAKRKHIKDLLIRCARQGAIPIVNYNDPVNIEENRRLELLQVKSEGNTDAKECIDNDETAAVISTLVKSKILVLLTVVDGIYKDVNDPKTLIREIGGKDPGEVVERIKEYKKYCTGSSRKGSNGAEAKLQFTIEPVENGTTVFIANAKYRIRDIINGTAPSTRIGTR